MKDRIEAGRRFFFASRRLGGFLSAFRIPHLLVALLALSGCQRSQLVEAELRAREDDLRMLRGELDQSLAYNQALQQELHSLHGEPFPPGAGPAPVARVPVRSLALGRQTSGYNQSERCPGDDALRVQVEPRDPEGQAVKVPGSLLVQALEISPEGLKQPLSSWEIPPAQLRRAWQSGLFTTGYNLILPWKVWPSSNKVRVIAQFKLADGRLFEADKDITVHVVPPEKRPAPTPDAVEPPAPTKPTVPDNSSDLPQPRRLDSTPPPPSPPPSASGVQQTSRSSPIAQEAAKAAPPSLWHRAPPPPPPPVVPAAEILRPIPNE